MAGQPSLQEWDSGEVLRRHLASAAGRKVLLGENAEAPRRFYSFAIKADGESLEIGLICSWHGIEPKCLLMQSPPRAVVGHDTSATWIDMHGGNVIKTMCLTGVFYGFLLLTGTADILVIHELGALRVNPDASILWSVTTDVVADVSIDTGQLAIKCLDEDQLTFVDIESGAIIGSGRP